MEVELRDESGTIRKKWTGRLPVALLYPNLYPVAVSNLGFQLVYGLLNADEDLVCERFVYPDKGAPLRSLESSRPLTDFPLVFASISFEHDYPRLAAMLAAGGIPPLAADRGERVEPGRPLVLIGGVAMFINPEPLAAFADLVAAAAKAEEREACAKVCTFGRSSADIEQAIRARSVGNRAYDRYEGETK